MKHQRLIKLEPQASIVQELPHLAVVARSLQPDGDDDFVQCVLRIVGAAIGMVNGHIAELDAIEARIRQEFGGERPYIGKTRDHARAERSQRDERIRAEHNRGDHAELLARRHHLTVRRIRQIVESV